MTDMDYDKMIEAMAKSIMIDDGCGYAINGERVLCDSKLVKDEADGYGTLLMQDVCDCRKSAKAALSALQDNMPEPDPDESPYDLLLSRSFFWTQLKHLGKDDKRQET